MPKKKQVVEQTPSPETPEPTLQVIEQTIDDTTIQTTIPQEEPLVQSAEVLSTLPPDDVKEVKVKAKRKAQQKKI